MLPPPLTSNVNQMKVYPILVDRYFHEVPKLMRSRCFTQWRDQVEAVFNAWIIGIHRSRLLKAAIAHKVRRFIPSFGNAPYYKYHGHEGNEGEGIAWGMDLGGAVGYGLGVVAAGGKTTTRALRLRQLGINARDQVHESA